MRRRIRFAVNTHKWGELKVLKNLITVGLVFWAGIMFWWMVVAYLNEGEWVKAATWFVCAVLCWTVWYWRVVREK